MITVLITGGIGSGKSAACRHLESKGIPVYDSDSRAKSLYDSDPMLLEQLVESFGQEIVGSDGRLDRKALASRVFADKASLRVLDSIVHPAVLRDFKAWRSSRSEGIVVMESALAQGIPEYRAVFDRVVLIEAPEGLRVSRACERDGAGASAIEERMSHQHFDRDDADAVIVNDGTLDELYEHIDSVFSKFAKSGNIMKTDLSRILSVSGHHGLFQYVAQARNGAIAQSLSDGKRVSFDAKSRISSLADIAVFTSEGELKLQEVFEKLHEVLGEEDAPSSKAPVSEIKALFDKAIPDYDQDRFYASHMKKVVDWYNDLKHNASLDFTSPDEEVEETGEAENDPANA